MFSNPQVLFMHHNYFKTNQQLDQLKSKDVLLNIESLYEFNVLAVHFIQISLSLFELFVQNHLTLMFSKYVFFFREPLFI